MQITIDEKNYFATVDTLWLAMQGGQFFPLNVIWDRITEKRLTEKHIRRRKYLLLF